MPGITANVSSALARDIYELTKVAGSKYAYARLNQLYGSIFDLKETDIWAAKTDGPI